MKNLDLSPIHSDGKPLEFEVISSGVAAPESESNLSYGLILRQQDSVNGKVDSGFPNSVDAVMLRKLKTDLDKLPDDEGFDQFEEVPIEGFGEALWAGYGWRPGMGIGRNAKEVVEVVEYKRRNAKEGIGFIDDNVNEVTELKIGREEGRRGDTGEVKHERIQVDENRTSSGVSWLRSHIRVRIISKSFKGGKFYLKKGVVMDAIGARTCDILMEEDREIVQGVNQDILETVLPRRGGPVLVLFGKHKGVYGSLVERDTERETAVVQDAGTHEMLHVQLEQIAEFFGDPSDIGY
ncbi:hypothetical protein SOVF_073830 [Spinacia oleracea]|nr:hypothetical protein SOVF_073830 [Spinacia oleracea]